MIRRFVALLAVATAAFASSVRTERRVYTFRCFDERGSERRLLYAAEVEGPPDVDFDVTLRDASHQVNVAFINEPLPSGRIESRIRLHSRRAMGQSPNGLPLWEEDDQRQRVTIGADEQIDLVPFGTTGEAGLLKIEITPNVVARAAAPSEPLRIHIARPAPDGAIEIAAYRSPHWYTADVALVRNGAPVARATGRMFVDEGATLDLDGTEVRITPGVVPFASRWEVASLRIDAPFAHGWSAVAIADKPATIPIDATQQLVVTLHPEGQAQ